MTRHSTDAGAFEIDSLPGQSQVAVCHSFFVRDDVRGQGNGHALKARQADELRLGNYDFAICTVAGGNTAQKRVLERAGWKKLAQFNNRRSCETTEVWGCTTDTENHQ